MSLVSVGARSVAACTDRFDSKADVRSMTLLILNGTLVAVVTRSETRHTRATAYKAMLMSVSGGIEAKDGWPVH
jgi:hypothetical protein